MTIVPVRADDQISRCIIHNRFFDGEVHTDRMLWQFGQAKEATNSSHESGVLRSLAPEASQVHEIGCLIARMQNDSRKNPPPGEKRRYYCGFRTASVADLPTQGDGYTIRYSHLPENGIHAHLDVALTIELEGRNARANARTDAGLALAEQFGPPEPHRCACDSDDDHHPFALWGESCLIDGLRDRWPDIYLPGTLQQRAANDDVSALPAQ